MEILWYGSDIAAQLENEKNWLANSKKVRLRATQYKKAKEILSIYCEARKTSTIKLLECTNITNSTTA